MSSHLLDRFILCGLNEFINLTSVTLCEAKKDAADAKLHLQHKLKSWAATKKLWWISPWICDRQASRLQPWASTSISNHSTSSLSPVSSSLTWSSAWVGPLRTNMGGAKWVRWYLFLLLPSFLWIQLYTIANVVIRFWKENPDPVLYPLKSSQNASDNHSVFKYCPFRI